jgi:recombination protein RecA
MSKLGEKLKAIRAVIGAIEKQFGKGAIMALGEGQAAAEVPAVSSGSLGLDLALGIGGIPAGRLVEIYGPESSGKTTIALHAIAESQRRGGLCAFIDAEHALDVGYAARLGVDVSQLLVSQPDCGEQALEIADHLVRSGAVSLIVVDSVAALVPRAELEGEMGDAHMGLQARLMSQAMRKLTGGAHRGGTTMIFINQTRQKIGVTYGSNVTTTGGNALKFYASVRVEIRRIASLKDGEQVVGNRTRAKVVKNKLAPPFKEAEFDIVYGRGVNRDGEIVDLALEAGVIKKSGSWFALNDTQLGQGRGAACAWLAEHADVRERLAAHLIERARQTAGSAPPATESEGVQQAAA